MAKFVQEAKADSEFGLIISSAYIYLARWAEKYNRELKQALKGDSKKIQKEDLEIAGKSIKEASLADNCVSESVTYIADFRMEHAFQLNDVDLSIEGLHTVNGIVFFRSISTNKLRKIRLVVMYTVNYYGTTINREVKLLEDDMDCDCSELTEIEQGSTLR